MNLRYYALLLITLLASCGKQDVTNEDPKREIAFLENSKIVFASKEESQALLGTSDVYTVKLDSFDLKSKTQNIKATKQSDYLQHAAAQAVEWTTAEIYLMTTVIADAESKIKSLQLNLELPQEIKLVKSTMQEEGGAGGYTRNDFIVFPAVASLHLFLHELFHIYSRANPIKRDALYATINFKKCNAISLPKSKNIMNVVNPDAPFYEHYVTVEIDGVQKDVVFVIYSAKEYAGGSFFGYIKKKLMLVEGGDANKKPTLLNSLPVLKDFSAASNLTKLIGNNTNYNDHPEEILAEHFALLITQTTVPDQSFLDAFKKILE